jgi:hypothetical protein
MSDFCEDHEYAYAGDQCPFCERSIGFDGDRAVELMTDPELADIEQEFHESSERLRHLDALIAHAEALERLYPEDKMVERQVVQEIRLKATQLRGSCS